MPIGRLNKIVNILLFRAIGVIPPIGFSEEGVERSRSDIRLSKKHRHLQSSPKNGLKSKAPPRRSAPIIGRRKDNMQSNRSIFRLIESETRSCLMKTQAFKPELRDALRVKKTQGIINDCLQLVHVVPRNIGRVGVSASSYWRSIKD